MGSAIKKSGIPRDQIYVTTKVLPESFTIIALVGRGEGAGEKKSVALRSTKLLISCIVVEQ